MSETIDRTQNSEEELDEHRDDQRQRAVSAAGAATADKEVELGSYDYYKNIHGQMDSTPEEEEIVL